MAGFAASPRRPDAFDFSLRHRGCCKTSVTLKKLARDSAPVETSEENCRNRLDNGKGSSPQHIRDPDARRFIAKLNRVREIRVWIKLNNELRRPSRASQTREHPLKCERPSGYEAIVRTVPPNSPLRRAHDGRRTGGGSISFMALSASDCASFVASTASSRLSL